jgi:hypothetical protein
VQDINRLKDTLEVQHRQFSQELRENSQDCSHRSQQLSHYVEAETKKVLDLFSHKHDKMKHVLTKLAEQFKNHLLNTDVSRKEVERRLNALERA